MTKQLYRKNAASFYDMTHSANWIANVFELKKTRKDCGSSEGLGYN